MENIYAYFQIIFSALLIALKCINNTDKSIVTILIAISTLKIKTCCVWNNINHTAKVCIKVRDAMIYIYRIKYYSTYIFL